ALGLEDVLEKNPPGLGQVSFGDSRLGLDGLEDEVGGVNLAMRVRVGDAYDLALVFEDQYVIDLFAAAEFYVLLLPDAHQVDKLCGLEFREGQVVAWAVADDAGDAPGGPVAVYARRGVEMARGVEAYAWMIVIEDERTLVIVVALAADAPGAGA